MLAKVGAGNLFWPTDEEIELARQMAATGRTKREIAARWCVSESVAHNRLMLLGIATNCPRGLPPSGIRERLQALLDDGKTPAQAARMLGMSRARAAQIIQPDKKQARTILQSAVRRGEVLVSPRCWACGQECPVEAHHEDYTRPLAVKWLCHPCHGRTMRKPVAA